MVCWSFMVLSTRSLLSIARNRYYSLGWTSNEIELPERRQHYGWHLMLRAFQIGPLCAGGYSRYVGEGGLILLGHIQISNVHSTTEVSIGSFPCALRKRYMLVFKCSGLSSELFLLIQNIDRFSAQYVSNALTHD